MAFRISNQGRNEQKIEYICLLLNHLKTIAKTFISFTNYSFIIRVLNIIYLITGKILIGKNLINFISNYLKNSFMI